MLTFKTRYTSVELGETVKISSKGKNSLEESYRSIFVESWDFTKNGGYIRVGAYIIHLEVNLEERLISLINAYLGKPYDYKDNETVLHCKAIKIQELSEL